jgi:hypothetical protein
VEGIGHGLIEVLSQNFSGGTEENDEIFEAGYPEVRSRFEWSAFRIQI